MISAKFLVIIIKLNVFLQVSAGDGPIFAFGEPRKLKVCLRELCLRAGKKEHPSVPRRMFMCDRTVVLAHSSRMQENRQTRPEPCFSTLARA
jgi:hypothetical protein